LDRHPCEAAGVSFFSLLSYFVSDNKGLISKEDVVACIDVMRKTGRHISESLYKQLMEKFR
jgi:hypothetical protein